MVIEIVLHNLMEAKNEDVQKNVSQIFGLYIILHFNHKPCSSKYEAGKNQIKASNEKNRSLED